MAWTVAENVFEAWIGDDEPTDALLVTTWIGKAEREIRFRIPGIQARIDLLEADLLENVVDVVVAMVIRKFQNPEGIRTANTTTGPFSESRTFGGNDPGELGMLPGEIDKLSVAAVSGQRAYTVDMIPATSRLSPDYVAVNWWEA